MKELVSHIEFLILQHECVIIPNIGGFVLNKEHACVLESGVILAPTVSVGFNADLRFNDGLLAESYMQKYDIPYDVAVKKIDEAAGQIRSELIARHEMTFGKMGVLRLDNGRIIYDPSLQYFTHPSVWGSSDIGLRRICDLLSQPEEERTGKRWRRVFIGVASTAAALALWTMMPFISDGMFQTIQQSGFFVPDTRQAANRIEYKPIITTERDAFLDKFAHNIAEQTTVVQPAVTPQTEEIVPETKPVAKPKEQPKPVLTKVKRYYIIVGGDSNKNAANRLLSKFKSEGLKSVDIVDSPDRHRIYVAVFKSKPEADAYLQRFRNKYPAHNDAWIYAKSTMEKSLR
jgi:hypothetical protein